jgi:pyrimidine-nucleoside phosphorylase
MSASFIPQEIIRAKRDGQKLTAEQLKTFFAGYLAGDIPDYQVSAMLMAMLLKGLDQSETVAMTKISCDSGKTLSWPYPKNLIVDKHSTGGIGDKTSLILMPLCLLEGLKVPMISGRGLGHTGGTLDKLEAIPGMNPKPSLAQAETLMRDLGGVFMGQTEEIAALDRRLYALRDVTATVECRPLIVASILSKKLAEGLGGLVLDVKFGSGAFISDQKESRLLAEQLVSVAKGCGLNTQAFHTSMDSPLGTEAGNWLEIRECINILQGKGPSDCRHLSLELAVAMVRMAYPTRGVEDIRETLSEHLRSGRAFEVFSKLIHAQGGDVSYLANPSKMPNAKIVHEVRSSSSGFVSAVQVRELGVAIVELGGGRKSASDKIDPLVGLSKLAPLGAKMNQGDLICEIHANDSETLRLATERVLRAYTIGSTKPKTHQLVAEVIQ